MIQFPALGIQSQEEFDSLPQADRIALAAAYFCDVVKVKEVGSNRGFWVEKFLKAVGLGGGYAWCAAFVSFCLKEAGIETGPKKGRAAVRNWENWASREGRLQPMEKAQRGDLVGYTDNLTGLGHIGICVGMDKRATNWKDTIEGNTNATGSRDGDGVYRKTRQARGNWWCIKL